MKYEILISTRPFFDFTRHSQIPIPTESPAKPMKRQAVCLCVCVRSGGYQATEILGSR